MCKGAKADLVFLIDGSWSIGDESFTKVRQFVFSMIGAFDVISHEGMQVTDPSEVMWLSACARLPDCAVIHLVFSLILWKQVSFVQYSDDAKTEFKLNTYHDKGMVLSALQMVNYRGGNTKTGLWYIEHIYIHTNTLITPKN